MYLAERLGRLTDHSRRRNLGAPSWFEGQVELSRLGCNQWFSRQWRIENCERSRTAMERVQEAVRKVAAFPVSSTQDPAEGRNQCC